MRTDVTLETIGDWMKHCALLVISLKDVELSAGHQVLLQGLKENAPVLINKIPAILDYVSDEQVEFFESGNSIDGIYQTKTSKIQNKIKVNGIIDEKIFEREDLEQKTSIALSKSNFADLIEKDAEFVGDFDFTVL